MQKDEAIIFLLSTLISSKITEEHLNKTSLPSTYIKYISQLLPDEAMNLLQNYKPNNITLSLIKHILQSRSSLKQHSLLNYSLYNHISGHNGAIESIVMDTNVNRTYLFTGGSDGTIKVWDIDYGTLISSLYGHNSGIVDMNICFNNKYLSTVDRNGNVVIWDLQELTIYHKITLEYKIIMSEFIREPKSTDLSIVGRDTAYETKYITLISSDSTLINLKFNHNCYEIVSINDCLSNKTIDTISVLEGRRIICVGGRWPFLLLFDLFDSEKLIMLEDFRDVDPDINIMKMVGSKYGFNIATAYANTMCYYKFYSLGMGCDGNNKFINSLRKQGYFDKYIIDVNHTRGMINTNNACVESMGFLCNNFLVVCCDDGFMRVYDNDSLIAVFEGEDGDVYTHPNRLVWAIVGNEISLYQLNGFTNEQIRYMPHLKENKQYLKPEFLHDQKVFIELFLTVPINSSTTNSLKDFVFSNNGLYFITTYEDGSILTYSLNTNSFKKYEEQFCILDFKPWIAESIIKILDHFSSDMKTNNLKFTSELIKKNEFIKSLYENLYSLQIYDIERLLIRAGDYKTLKDIVSSRVYDRNKNVLDIIKRNYLIGECMKTNFTFVDMAATHFNKLKLNKLEFDQKFNNETVYPEINLLEDTNLEIFPSSSISNFSFKDPTNTTNPPIATFIGNRMIIDDSSDESPKSVKKVTFDDEFLDDDETMSSLEYDDNMDSTTDLTDTSCSSILTSDSVKKLKFTRNNYTFSDDE
ncbi:PRP46 [Hepatospora eriocheir]|uniref:PRP46 n=1 Tax=Hepatospora eriocheir TaxID=1081669 RepID=A0A1X0QCT3_9MICR|nr:PRP46 [Hepatospora eriocheir]